MPQLCPTEDGPPSDGRSIPPVDGGRLPHRSPRPNAAASSSHDAEATHSMYRRVRSACSFSGGRHPGSFPAWTTASSDPGDARGGGDGHSGRTCRAGQHDQHGDSRSPLHDDPPVGVVGLRRETSGEEHADATSAPALRPRCDHADGAGRGHVVAARCLPGGHAGTRARGWSLHCERGCDGDVLGAGAARAGSAQDLRVRRRAGPRAAGPGSRGAARGVRRRHGSLRLRQVDAAESRSRSRRSE